MMKHKWLLGFSLCAALCAEQAHAQGVPGSWQRRDRRRHESPQNFAFEARFGAYSPEVDTAFSGATPYADTFGNGANFYIGLEVDWQALRIPYVGSFGPGVGWGYTTTSEKAKITGTEEVSGEDTSLSIQPMYAVGVLRMDVLSRELHIPLAFYGKLGLGFALWSSSNGSGVSERENVVAKGRSWGPHFALGGMFNLDVFDESAAMQMDESSGVNHSYIFIEWMRNRLGNDGMIEGDDQLFVGTSTWVLGLALEI